MGPKARAAPAWQVRLDISDMQWELGTGKLRASHTVWALQPGLWGRRDAAVGV